MILLFIDTQLLPTGERRKPKNKKSRTAFMLPGAYEAVKEWLDIPQSDKDNYRRGGKKITEAVRAACKELWADDPDKHLTFRDLRHIVGVYYSENGLSDTQISKFMGNTPEVSRMHYQRFMVSDDGIRLARLTLGVTYG